MKVLLDTHVFLWIQAEPERIAPAARSIVEDRRSRLLLSAASSWEIAIKFALGRLSLPADPERWVPQRLRSSRVTPLAIEHGHALAAGALPPHHRDPFDRLLIAQARAEQIPLMTADPAFGGYDVEVIDA